MTGKLAAKQDLAKQGKVRVEEGKLRKKKRKLRKERGNQGGKDAFIP